MIFRSSDEVINSYYERAAVNQSSLKVILSQGMIGYLDLESSLLKQENYYEEKEHRIIGSGVDYFITSGEEAYNNRYFYSRLKKKPKDKALSVLHMVYDRVLEKSGNTIDGIWEFDYYLEDVYIACNEHGYYMNRKAANYEGDNRYKEIVKANGNQYWRELKESNGKIILSDDLSQIINQITNSLLTHPHTANLFKDKTGFNGEREVDIVYQFPIYFRIGDVYCKALLDMIRIDHINKVIYPIDIKTTKEYITNFNRDIKRWRYDIQASFYTTAILLNLTQLVTHIDHHLFDYRVANLAFIAESTKKPGVPLIFPLTDKAIQRGLRGDEECFGWSQALDLYRDWSKKGFSLEKVLDNSGVIFVDENFEYNKIF
jgi:hypothetical protein